VQEKIERLNAGDFEAFDFTLHQMG
jgi:hypothetical protein